jgi:micrococcal nuclease
VIILTLCAAALGAVVSYSPGKQGPAAIPAQASVSSQTAFVERAVDGDTLKLSNRERVRLIGVDTPEMHESAKLYRDAERTGQDVKVIQGMGRQAYEFTRALVEGKTVRLEFDVQPRDKYNRLLAYVYLEDGTFVNAEIMRNGYAYPMVIPPDVRHAEEFRALFVEARRLKKGLWKDTDPGHER